MTIINFPGVDPGMPEPTEEDKIENIKEDIQKLEEYLEETTETIDGVLLVTFAKRECRHWITPGLSVPEIYFMLSRIQNDLLDYAGEMEQE